MMPSLSANSLLLGFSLLGVHLVSDEAQDWYELGLEVELEVIRCGTIEMDCKIGDAEERALNLHELGGEAVVLATGNDNTTGD